MNLNEQVYSIAFAHLNEMSVVDATRFSLGWIIHRRRNCFIDEAIEVSRDKDRFDYLVNYVAQAWANENNV